MRTTIARRFLGVLEPLVSTLYFAPEAVEEYEGLGLDPFTGYFMARSAGMGAASPAAVAAAFNVFNPTLVAQHVRWDTHDPAKLVDARTRAVRRAYERLLPEEPGGAVPDVSRAVALLREAQAACRPEGRVLFASNAGLAWPTDDLSALWHGANLLREYRGDGHVLALVRNGVGAVQSLVMHAAYLEISASFLERSRAWPDEAYARAREALRGRGFMDAEGALTDAGVKFRDMIEMETDRLAMAPFEALGEAASEELYALLRPLAERIVERRGVPRGLTRMAPNAW